MASELAWHDIRFCFTIITTYTSSLLNIKYIWLIFWQGILFNFLRLEWRLHCEWISIVWPRILGLIRTAAFKWPELMWFFTVLWQFCRGFDVCMPPLTDGPWNLNSSPFYFIQFNAIFNLKEIFVINDVKTVKTTLFNDYLPFDNHEKRISLRLKASLARLADAIATSFEGPDFEQAPFKNL